MGVLFEQDFDQGHVVRQQKPVFVCFCLDAPEEVLHCKIDDFVTKNGVPVEAVGVIDRGAQEVVF